jgi:hypothetical protein
MRSKVCKSLEEELNEHMNKINKNYIGEVKDKKEESILSVFCFDTVSVGEAFRSIVQQNFGREVRTSLQELGEVLKGIHIRLVSEGYSISNGKYYKK